MTKIVWDAVGSRVYENGVDRGVLYLPDGSSVPWNGLTAVIEKINKTATGVYFDGVKISNILTAGDFAATLKAVTYPDEFLELEGAGELRNGVYLSDQRPQTFALSYRTMVGNDVEGREAGYKLHILYNVLAVPSDKTYASLADDPMLVEFEWNLTAVPEDIDGFSATSHLIIDSRKVDPLLLEEIEILLYGNSEADSVLLPMQEFVTMMAEWYRVKIIDNGDETWEAIESRPGFIFEPVPGQMLLLNVNALYTSDTTYIISDTLDGGEVPQITIEELLDGTWIASTSNDNVIVVIGDPDDGVVEIRNATLTYLTPDEYEITDTFD